MTPPRWFKDGRPLAPGELEALNDDVHEILDPHEWDWEWRLCRVPIDAIAVPNPDFHDEARMVRLRREPCHAPIIVSLRASDARLLDGGHRIKVARERGHAGIAALVGRPGRDVDHDTSTGKVANRDGTPMPQFTATNIVWDTDGEVVPEPPTETTVEAGDEDGIADALSDAHGFCVESFSQ